MLVMIIMQITAAKRAYKTLMLCKDIDVVPRLGDASCICADKTGTLT